MSDSLIFCGTAAKMLAFQKVVRAYLPSVFCSLERMGVPIGISLADAIQARSASECILINVVINVVR